MLSLFVNFSEELQGLFVGNHAFVGALHFVLEHQVDVGAGALFEARRHRHLIEKISIQGDVLEICLCTCSHVGGPQSRVLCPVTLTAHDNFRSVFKSTNLKALYIRFPTINYYN